MHNLRKRNMEGFCDKPDPPLQPSPKVAAWIGSYWRELFKKCEDHRAPNGGARESTQGAKGICNPIGGTTLWTNQYPGALDSSCICIKRWSSRPSLEREAHWTCKLYMPQYRGTPGPKRGSGWVGEWGWVGMGDFWYSIGNVNELNT
jgi:hypothetical protein